MSASILCARSVPTLLCVAVLSLGRATPALAQAPTAALLDGTVGYLGFVDEDLIGHTALAGSARYYVTGRIALGGELAWLRGPDIDRDWVITGNATIDLLADRTRARPRPVVPYVVGGAGLMWTTLRVGTGPYSSSDIFVTFGGGARVAIGDRWYVAPEFRTGWEPHLRTTLTVGYRMR